MIESRPPNCQITKLTLIQNSDWLLLEDTASNRGRGLQLDTLVLTSSLQCIAYFMFNVGLEIIIRCHFRVLHSCGGKCSILLLMHLPSKTNKLNHLHIYLVVLEWLSVCLWCECEC